MYNESKWGPKPNEPRMIKVNVTKVFQFLKNLKSKIKRKEHRKK